MQHTSNIGGVLRKNEESHHSNIPGIQLLRSILDEENTATAVAESDEFGIDIVRSFMQSERSSDGGSSEYEYSEYGRADRCPDHRADCSDYGRTPHDFGVSPVKRADDSFQWRREDNYNYEPSDEMDEPEEPAPPPCTFFFSPSGCRFGDNCKFSHEVAVPVCPFFVSGFCRYGEACQYAHPELGMWAEDCFNPEYDDQFDQYPPPSHEQQQQYSGLNDHHQPFFHARGLDLDSFDESEETSADQDHQLSPGLELDSFDETEEDQRTSTGSSPEDSEGVHADSTD